MTLDGGLYHASQYDRSRPVGSYWEAQGAPEPAGVAPLAGDLAARDALAAALGLVDEAIALGAPRRREPAGLLERHADEADRDYCSLIAEALDGGGVIVRVRGSRRQGDQRSECDTACNRLHGALLVVVTLGRAARRGTAPGRGENSAVDRCGRNTGDHLRPALTAAGAFLRCRPRRASLPATGASKSYRPACETRF